VSSTTPRAVTAGPLLLAATDPLLVAAADPLLLAADVGNSKTDLALLRADGTVLAAVRGPTASHQAVGLAAATEALAALLGQARAEAGLAPAARPGSDLAVICAAGADFAAETRQLARGHRLAGVATTVIVRNDTHAALRAGTEAGWGVAVVCGAGINCTAIAPGGREARFPSLGSISGDWGGGGALGTEALAAAVRARDGRGPRTALERLVPARFGLRRPVDVTMALYRGRLAEDRLGDLAPDVFAAATEGDSVARAIVDRLADEVVAMVAAAIRRAGLVRREPQVVLAGGVFRTEDEAFYERIRRGVADGAAGARVTRLDAPPVVGAALLALDRLDRPDRAGAAQRVRAGLTADQLEPRQRR
jgi:N-acetylglucosamine kinase-like BadF-type ATPase